MSLDPSSVTRAVAPRLAARIGRRASVLVQAPAEFWPLPLALAALTLASDGRPVRRLDLRSEAGDLTEALAADEPLLIEAAGPDAGDQLTALARATETRLLHAPCLTVRESDDRPGAAELAQFDLVLDHRDLTLSTDEVRGAAADPDPQSLHDLLAETGGVPELVYAALTSNDGEGVRGIAAGWAERVDVTVIADPLLALHVWCGRLHEETVAALAGTIFGRAIPLEAVRRARSASVVTRVPGHDPSIPDALAAALRAALGAHGGRVPGRKSLVTAVTSTAIEALEAVRLLTRLGDWAALDRVLGAGLHLLVHLAPAQRARYARRWPSPVPERLTHLAAARRLVDPQEPKPSTPGVLTPWHDLGRLYVAERLERGSIADDVRERLTTVVVPGRPWTHAEAQDTLTTTAGWVWARCRRIETAGAEAHADEAASLTSLLLCVTQAAVRIGDLPVALASVRRAARIMHALGGRAEWYPTLRHAVLAHAAYTSAIAGGTNLAAVRLTSFEHIAHTTETPDDTTLAVAALAERHVEVGRGAVPAATSLSFVDTERDFAPEEAAVRASSVLVRHGPTATIDWLHTMLGKAMWTESPTWAWWSMNATLALLYARTAQPRRAQQWLERSPLPPTLGLAVRAHVAMAGDYPQAAEQLAQEVLGLPEVPPRWRLLALGARLEALLATGRPDESEVAVAAETWDDQVGTVALFGERSRALVVSRLTSEAVRKLPGLAAITNPEPVKDVHLTNRQLDVLRGLASGATMGQVAGELYLGTETVRSTAKELYKRLGVHDRNSAVQVGRALGMI